VGNGLETYNVTIDDATPRVTIAEALLIRRKTASPDLVVDGDNQVKEIPGCPIHKG